MVNNKHEQEYSVWYMLSKYEHCKFQGVESTQKVLFGNQKRSKRITE